MTRIEQRKAKHPETSSFHYFNANPKNRLTGDCWARAVCTATEIPYNDVVMDMAKLHCETGYDSSLLIGKYLEKLGWVKHKQPRHEDNTKFTGKEFCEFLKKTKRKERIVANIGGHHVVAIIDCKVNDTWDSTDGCIGNFWTK